MKTSFRNLVGGVFVAGLLFVGPSQAGSPIDELMTCPIGGAKFKTVSTASCSRMGTTLSLKPITSCDFVTRLPVCPDNGLPIFKDFSDAEIALIEPLLTTSAYKILLQGSAYKRAAWLALQIAPDDTRSRYFLLQSGLQYDWADISDLDLYLTDYHKALAAALPELPEGSRVFYQLSSAFHHHRAGQADKAATIYQSVVLDHDSENDYLAGYIKQIGDCLARPANSQGCTAATRIAR